MIDRLDATIRAAGIPIDGVSGSQGNIRVDYQVSATGPQLTQGASIVAAFDWSTTAQATSAAKVAKASATASIDNGQLQSGVSTERLVRALALVVLDEVNILRAASVPTLTARTAAQLVTAIKAKIALTVE